MRSIARVVVRSSQSVRTTAIQNEPFFTLSTFSPTRIQGTIKPTPLHKKHQYFPL